MTKEKVELFQKATQEDEDLKELAKCGKDVWPLQKSQVLNGANPYWYYRGARWTTIEGQQRGNLIERDGKKYKIFYGMSSSTAMKKHAGGIAEYRSSEGKTVEVPYRGNVKDTVLDMLGGLRSACTYVGASRLKELSRRTTFIRVTQQLNNVFTN